MLAGRLAARQPGRLVLAGEAGIGKTILWESGIEAARAVGVRVLVTRSSRAERELPFAGLADLAAGLGQEALVAFVLHVRHCPRVAADVASRRPACGSRGPRWRAC
jgi:hypothetical protein